jgi:hypothetical protein
MGCRLIIPVQLAVDESARWAGLIAAVIEPL